MTEPKPSEQYCAVDEAGCKYFTNTTWWPRGESTDPLDEFVLWDELSDEALKITDKMIDGPLPRLPLKVLPIELILKIGGKGKPTFKLEVEISLVDESDEWTGEGR